jgi:hypothetical protein
MLVVSVANARIFNAADEGSPVVFTADKGVLLEMLESPNNGWVKVRHRDGLSGFVKAGDVWGDWSQERPEMKITILGAGAWGTALAILARHHVVLWGAMPGLQAASGSAKTASPARSPAARAGSGGDFDAGAPRLRRTRQRC